MRFRPPFLLAAVMLVLSARVTTGAAQDGTAPLLINVDHRATTSLAGPWHVIIDPYEAGYYNYRREPNPDGYFVNAKPASKSDRIEYDFDTSPTLTVPGDWNTQRCELLYYEGTVWYQRTFDFTPTPGRRVFLYFGAANYEARVYLNGEPLGRHAGGFTPFCFEVTERVRAGENFVVVKVDNTRRPTGVPAVNTDWWNYGGLTRRVLLVETPATFIREFALHLDPANPRDITGWEQLDGAQRAQPVRVELPEIGFARDVGTTDPSGRVAFRFAAPELTLWSPENPRLYRVRLVAETDALEDRVGFRSLCVAGRDILLNDAPVFLRGVCLHEEAPLRGGRAHSSEDARTLLGWAQELGCNFVRLAHYPHNEALVRAADELGLLVWAEIPVYWTIDWECPETYACAERQLTEMITRDRNRACVALWSVGNETPRTPERLAFMRRLIERARTLDATRLLTAALESRSIDATTLTIDDPLGEFVDVLACNRYVGWYDGLPEKADTLTWTTCYAKPLIMSEFGAAARAGFHADDRTRWSEEYQADAYRHQLAMLARIDFLRGMSPWILMDFRSPRRPLPGIQDGWNRKGLISDRGERKAAFFIVQDHYRERQAATRTGD